MNPADKIELLLVEDDPQDLELTIRALRKAHLGSRLHVVRDGAEALDYLFGRQSQSGHTRTAQPRVILLDLKLPKIDGLTVLQRIREDDRTAMIPVVILTSSMEQSDVVRGYQLGVNSYIVKPVNFERFLGAVTELGLYWLLLNQPPSARD